MSEEITVRIYALFDRPDFINDFKFNYFHKDREYHYVHNSDITALGNFKYWDYFATIKNTSEKHLAELIWYVMNNAIKFSIDTDDPDDALRDYCYQICERNDNESMRFMEWAVRRELIDFGKPSKYTSKYVDGKVAEFRKRSHTLEEEENFYYELAFENNLALEAFREVPKDTRKARKTLLDCEMDELKALALKLLNGELNVDTLRDSLYEYADRNTLSIESVLNYTEDLIKPWNYSLFRTYIK